VSLARASLLGVCVLSLLSACAHTGSQAPPASASNPAVQAPEPSSAPAPTSQGPDGGSCRHGLALEGMLMIPTCPAEREDCAYAIDALNAYAQLIEDRPDQLTVLVASSPWRFYLGDGRILAVESMAEQIRSQMNDEVREVVLYASWSGVAPSGRMQSLAQRLSSELDGFPVRGMDGFLWIEPDGRLRTTHQAYSGWHTGGGYRLAADQPVLTTLAFGQMLFFSEQLRKDELHELLLDAAVGWDVHMLCPDRALAEFELLAPELTIAAYNAAVMHLESGTPDGREAALRLLESAVARGDAPARELLSRLQSAPAQEGATQATGRTP
jgi:hypothetical protein